MAALDAFTKGDFIEVTPLERDKGTRRDWGVLRGTAMDNLSKGGTAVFNLLPDPAVRTYENAVLELRFNANEVDVRLLFSARIARTS